jgi:hypothetical protein
VVAAPVAWGRGERARPSITAPQAAAVSQRSAEVSAVVDTAGLGGSLSVAYGRGSAATTRLLLGTIGHDTPAGRRGGRVSGLTPGTTYHFRLTLTTIDGTVTTPDATVTTAPATTQATSACRVPALKGRTLTSARRALRRAGCRTGQVRRPTHVGRGRRLVVAAQSVRAGRVVAAQTRVNVRLRID